MAIDIKKLIDHGLSEKKAQEIIQQIQNDLNHLTPEEVWKKISTDILSPLYPFQIHLDIFTALYPHWPQELDSAPAIIPDPAFIKTTHIAQWMAELKIESLKAFHAWTVDHYSQFLQKIIETLRIVFDTKPTEICRMSHGVESPEWLPGAKLNIINSCFSAPKNKTAIVFLNKNNKLEKLTYAELNLYSNRIANSLVKRGFIPGDRIAILLPMNKEAVAIYLGIIKMGGVVVSIADSFSAEEINTRVLIAHTKAIFTQDSILRDDKTLPLYEKVIASAPPTAIVLPCRDGLSLTLRQQDVTWDDFLVEQSDFSPFPADPGTHCNILFSSGTTSTPKAIPWNHTTGIKAASDAYFHQNIEPDDILAWPTNLGWMMGPWLIYAAFINQATLALYPDTPNHREFGQFIQDANVTMLGVVPLLVASWRKSHCMEGLHWQSIKKFTSTGECSNAVDMLYLMSLAGYKPIIEYCGGTEISGAYISSTMIEKNYPSLFSTPAMGMDFVLLNEHGEISDQGEVALIPPAIGLSTELLNANHHAIYYANMPTLPNKKIVRRHGDEARRFPNGYYCMLGRTDDTMNLGGIKISSAEIERVLSHIDFINETAAISVTLTHQGPSYLVIYAATDRSSLLQDGIKKIMQTRINEHLNPLFKIYDIVFIKELPKTASNKIMRRTLRKNYLSDKMKR